MRRYFFFTTLSLCTLIFCLCISFISERSVRISFMGFFNDHILEQDVNYYLAKNNDSIAVHVCRFYISDVELLAGEEIVANCRYKLMDLFDTASTHLDLKVNGQENITTLRFKLGIDSTTNANGVGGGDLDPMKGMYWSWQSGYINLKLEGTSRLSPERQGVFEYHLGGYAGQNNALQTVTLTVKDERRINAGVDVARFFVRNDVHTLARVMSPSLKAVELAGHATHMFFIEP